MIVRNSVRCLVCRQEVESARLDDFVACPCGNLAVDGGHEYLRRTYRLPNSIDDTSTVIADDDLFPVDHEIITE